MGKRKKYERWTDEEIAYVINDLKKTANCKETIKRCAKHFKVRKTVIINLLNNRKITLKNLGLREVPIYNNPKAVKYLAELVVKYPGNLKKAFAETGDKFGVKGESIAVFWYSYKDTLMYRGNMGKLFMIKSKSVSHVNRKNINYEKEPLISKIKKFFTKK